ncbi:hypothetical protein DRQ07_00920 [candidate division KSB1 bacterium]|nr:MAG: hypothetical protein DRQ07_00920 [candidate division KSB1 bacterium]
MTGKKKKNSPRKKAVLLLTEILKSKDKTDTDTNLFQDLTEFNDTDRSLITEIVQGTLRQLKYLDRIAGQLYNKKKWSKTPHVFRRSIEICLYQIIFTDKIPDYAAINETVGIVKEMNGNYWARVANGMMRSFVRDNDRFTDLSGIDDEIELMSTELSHPVWLVNKFTDIFGPDQTRMLCMANNKRPVFSVRVNTAKTYIKEVLQSVRKLDPHAVQSSVLPDFIRVKNIGSVLKSDLFLNGLISVQDESAGLAARLMDPSAGELIADVASAPGGKLCYMAELSPDSDFIALDIKKERLALVRDNCRRTERENIFYVTANALNLPLAKVDKLLLDAPCTGSGVLGKRADLRWKRKPEQLEKIIRLQEDLLDTCSEHVKKGGVLVYSTCTILPEENHIQISKFLSKHKEYFVERAENFVNSSVTDKNGYVYTLPHIHSTDGSFAVRLKKRVEI